jgi:predicted NBD/HSP70 family sugar kinase
MSGPDHGAKIGGRGLSRTRVIGVLQRKGLVSRAELESTTGLSRATVSAVVATLRDEGVVIEEPLAKDERNSGRGRPPKLLRFNSVAGAVLAIAFGRSSVRAAVADLSLEVLAEDSMRLDLPTTPNHDALAAAGAVAEDVIRSSGIRRDRLIGAGVSLPMPLDLTEDRVAAKVVPPWADARPRRSFEELTGLPVYVDNDANSAALAELRWGAGRTLSDFIYVKLAPGVGGAIVSGGALYHGAAGFAGEIGHIRVAEHGPVCACGNRGCLGPSVSTRNLVEGLIPTHGHSLTPGHALELLAEGDIEATRIVRDAGRVLGQTLANLCNLLNPEAILIGGAITTAAGEAVISGVREAIDKCALPPNARSVEVRLATVGERGELLGALTLVPINERVISGLAARAS